MLQFSFDSQLVALQASIANNGQAFGARVATATANRLDSCRILRLVASECAAGEGCPCLSRQMG